MAKQGTERRRGDENANCDDRTTPPTPLRGHPPSLVVPPRISLSNQELLKHMLNEDSSFRLLESKGRNCTVHLIRTPDGQSHTCSMHNLAIDLLRKAQGCTHLGKATTYSYAASLVMSAWNRIIKPSLFTVNPSAIIGKTYDEHTINLWHDLHEHPKAAFFEKMIVKHLGAYGGGCLHKIQIRLADAGDMDKKISLNTNKDPLTTIRDTGEFLSDCEHWLASIDQPSLYGNIEEARIQLVLLAAKLLPTLRSTITELSSLHGAHSKDKDVLVVETKLLGIRVLSKIGQHQVAQKEIDGLTKQYGSNPSFKAKILLANARAMLSTVGTIDSISLFGSSDAYGLFYLAQKKLHEILVLGEDTEKTIIWIEAKRMKTTVEEFLAMSRIDGFFEVLRKLVGVSVGLSGDHHFCVEHQAKEEFCRRGNLAFIDSFALMVFVLNDFGLNYTSNIEHRESKFTKETLQKLKLATLEDGFVDALKAFPFSQPGTATRIFLAERLVPGKLALLYNALIGRRWLAYKMQSCTSIFGTHFDSFFSGEDRNEQSKIECCFFVRTAKDIQDKGDEEWTKGEVGQFLKLFHEQCDTRKALKAVLQFAFDIENDEVKFDLYDCALKLAKKVPYPSIFDDLEDDLEEDEHGLVLASIGFLRAKHQHLAGASREEVLEWFGDTYGHTCWEVAAKVEFHMMALKRLEENGAFKDAIAGYDEDLGEGLIGSENAQKIQEAKWQCVNRCFKHFLVKASKKSHKGLSEGTLWNILSVLGLDPTETKVVECMRKSLHQVFGNANASTTKGHGISLAAYFHREATRFQMLLKEIQIEIDNSCIEPEDSISLKLLQEAPKKKLSQLSELNKPYQASTPQPINY